MDGEFVTSVRHSRIGVNFEMPAASRSVAGRMEFDLLGVGANSGHRIPRLRHGFGSYGRLLVGQTWSLFCDENAFPRIMEVWGPSGIIMSRRPQIRWTPVDDGRSFLAVAAENPSAGADAGKAPQIDENFDARLRGVVPDVTARFRRSGRRGYLQLAGVLRSLHYEGSLGEGPTYSTFDGSKTAGGGEISGWLRTRDEDGFRVLFAYGAGISNYASDAEPVPLVCWIAFYEHRWTPRWSTTVGASELIHDNTDGQQDDALRRGRYAIVNVLYEPLDRLTYGIEFQWAERENKDGAAADDYRVQCSARYDF